MTGKRISESTIHRLSLYYRLLKVLQDEGYETVSSKDLADREKLTPAQVRKDLSFFGQFGTRGLGYPVTELRQQIAEIIGINKKWNVALVGIGNVGSALVSYKEFQKQGFHIKLIFDNDQRKIGSFHKGIEVHDVVNLRQMLNKYNIEIVIVAVPGAAAQGVVNEVVAAGVNAILSFAPTNLRVPSHVTLRSENMAIEMEHLTFHLTNENLYYTA
ncbi:MAG: redox-sensing transcriptional repressor Rex [candidate division Zixibacteria bacterium]|nr:redox-sensing transcriptional repressor Rex [candidate division Zixibacteria bacterium]